MLNILAIVDGKVHKKEEVIIRKYMSENFADEIDFDKELDAIVSMPPENYAIHFNDAMNLFYMQSNNAERNHFLDMATRLIVADKKIAPKENLFLNELYYAWEEETEE